MKAKGWTAANLSLGGMPYDPPRTGEGGRLVSSCWEPVFHSPPYLPWRLSGHSFSLPLRSDEIRVFLLCPRPQGFRLFFSLSTLKLRAIWYSPCSLVSLSNFYVFSFLENSQIFFEKNYFVSFFPFPPRILIIGPLPLLFFFLTHLYLLLNNGIAWLYSHQLCFFLRLTVAIVFLLLSFFLINTANIFQIFSIYLLNI